jgi:hypothetical protein
MKNTRHLACALAVATATCFSASARAAPRCYPTHRFEVIDNELVRDTLTKLVWQRQASSTHMILADAQTYCPAGFRLPTERELSSIVDFTVADPGPTIDGAAFPNTPASGFWTSSPSTSSSYDSRCVMFNDGASMNCIGYYYVRCVR